MSTDDRLSFGANGPVIDSPWGAAALGTVMLDGGRVAGPWTAGPDGSFTTDHGPWRLTVRAWTDPARFALELRNRDSVPHEIDRVVFAAWTPRAFSPGLRTEAFRELVHGGNFLSLASGVKCVGRKGLGLDFVPTSNMVTVYQAEDGNALLLGVLPPLSEAFSEFRTLHSDPHFEGAFGFEVRHEFQCEIEPGAAQSTSPLVALGGSCGTELLQRYGAAWATLLARKNPKPPKIGWNSWDYLAGAVTRRDVDRNIAAARKLFGDALEVFALDEGWECQWGTWSPNWKFPEGLEDFCRHVRSQGGTPGVWTAPLLVNTYNPLFLEHPDWFASRADGQLQTDSYSYGPMAYLDVTRPEVLEHVRGVFSRLRETGFEYFKVDFGQCILKARRFQDRRVGRNGLLRKAFQVIREAIGDDAYLLSCGSPYESVVGLADAVRSTGDIHIFWGHVLRNAGALSVRWWMGGNLWNCDPDFLVVRGPDTARPPYAKRRVTTPLGPDGGWMAGREFNESEARAYALLVHLTGGDVMLGDVLEQLNRTGSDMIRRVLEPREAPAVPVDLFTSDQDLPRVWIGRGRKDTLVGLFNWTDKTAATDFDPGRWGLGGTPRDFWTEQLLESLPERLPRRSALALVYDSPPV
ncbi:MAG: alpha-galactosidase [Kiritimatiellaeota bacterium]|nr:alpha-galactosidase [Kiritimatiellota bacterium]